MMLVLIKQEREGNAILLHAFSSVEKLQEYKTKHKLTNKTTDGTKPRYIYLVEKLDLD